MLSEKNIVLSNCLYRHHSVECNACNNTIEVENKNSKTIQDPFIYY